MIFENVTIVGKWLLFKAKWAIFQLYNCDRFNENDDGVHFVLDQHTC